MRGKQIYYSWVRGKQICLIILLSQHCWRRDRLPTPVFLGFLGSSAVKESICNVRDLGLIPGLGRSPGEGNSYPLQYSGLENSMDCVVHGVTKSQTQPGDFHFHFTFYHSISSQQSASTGSSSQGCVSNKGQMTFAHVSLEGKLEFREHRFFFYTGQNVFLLFQTELLFLYFRRQYTYTVKHIYIYIYIYI